ncbi:MAG: UDP-glucose 4-epimerase GalE [Magnetococcales bacterium]|nr:UDP-glucose 4-epimerase GalE [Magnetococcales bacterium]
MTTKDEDLETFGDTILVTGGAGYIGSHTCKALAEAGYKPVVLDNFSNSNSWAVRWGPLEEGDIGDKGFLDGVMQRHQPKAVIHFAGLIEVGESVKHPARYYQNNVSGTISLLSAMERHGVDKIIFSSSAAVYGTPELPAPLDEECSKSPVNPYGQTKLMAEKIIADFGESYGLGYVLLRYFNAAGADPAGELGESHDPESHLIPRLLEAAHGSGAGATINGDDYDTPDGSCVRDYIHVSDLAAAHVLALGKLENGLKNGIYNLGYGRGYSVKEVLQAVCRVTGVEVKATIAPRRAGDPPSLVADPSKVITELGWSPKHDTLDEIVSTAWSWFSRQSQ